MTELLEIAITIKNIIKDRAKIHIIEWEGMDYMYFEPLFQLNNYFQVYVTKTTQNKYYNDALRLPTNIITDFIIKKYTSEYTIPDTLSLVTILCTRNKVITKSNSEPSFIFDVSKSHNELFKLLCDTIIDHTCICNYLKNSVHDNGIKQLNILHERDEYNINTLNVLAEVHHKLNDYNNAKMNYQKIINIDPNNKEALDNLYTLYLRVLSKNPKSVLNKSILLEMLHYYPTNDIIYTELAEIYTSQDDIDMAIDSYKTSLRFDPTQISVYHNIALLYFLTNRLEMSIKYSEKANKLDPNNAVVLTHLGLVYKKVHKYKEAIECYDKAIKLVQHTDNIEIKYTTIVKYLLEKLEMGYGDVLIETDFLAKLYELDVVIKKHDILKHKTFIYHQALMLFYDYIYETNFNKRLNINSIYNVPQHSFSPYKFNNNKIKVGYVSGDLFHSPITTFMHGIFTHHNTNKFEIHCYANNSNVDECTEKIKNINLMNWHNIAGVNDEEVANQIFKDKIDILIDLAGMSINTRLGVFAYKPSRVQITYLGFPNTTGMHTMDYRITDEITDAKTSAQQYTEKLLYMPNCFLCYTPNSKISHLKTNTTVNTFIVFGTLNKLAKINKGVLKLWSEILKKVPDSKILLKIDIRNTPYIDFVLTQLNIKRDRLICIGKQDIVDFFDTYNRIDIALDTFPFSGATTTCDALYMNIPVITYFIKNSHVHDVTSSILINSGLSELVAYSHEEYINKAVDLANNKSKILEYKRNVRDKLMKCMNPVTFTHEFERLLLQTLT